MGEEAKLLLRNIGHHFKWGIVLLFAVLPILIAKGVAGS